MAAIILDFIKVNYYAADGWISWNLVYWCKRTP